MTNSVKNSAKNNSRFNQFQNVVIEKSQLKNVKGGEVIIDDIIEQ